MGKESREKGRRGEYEIRDWLKKMTGVEFIRTPLSGGLHLSFPWDVMKHPRVSNNPTPFDDVGLEVKNTKNLKIPEWIRQCEDAEQDYKNFQQRKWVLFFKQSGKWYASMPVEQLERFINNHKEMELLKK